MEVTSHPFPLNRVCVVYRARPCPLYRVISWLSKHIHSAQVLRECLYEVRSPFIHLLSSAPPFLDSLVRACIQALASHSGVLPFVSFLFLSLWLCELEEG